MKQARAWERKCEKRTLLSPDEDSEIQDFMRDVREAAGIRVNFSELTRAAWTVVLQNDGAILRKLKREKKHLYRPETKDPQSGLDFEYQLADIIEKAVRARK